AQALLAQANTGQIALDLAQEEIVELVRSVLSDAASDHLELDQARTLLSQLFALPRPFLNQLGLSQQRVALLEAYVEARQFTEAKVLATELLAVLPATGEQNQLYCRVTFAMGRSAAGLSDAKSATDAFDWVSRQCEDSDLTARALFLAAGQRAGVRKRAEAIANYAELEARFPSHRLADDARLKQANLYRAMGADSRFVELLDRMPDDYPNGDMVVEGLFQLALKSMAAHQWSTALSVMERSERLTPLLERAKDVERDRHAYFLARARIATGQRERGLEQLRDLVVRRPLSFYMLQAYSALMRTRPELASTALTAAISNQAPASPALDAKSSREQEILERMLLLLGVGDVKAAEATLRTDGTRQLGQVAVTTMARMFANAGAPRTALLLVKRNRMDCRVAWPSGSWTEFWKQFYPRPYAQIAKRESSRHQVPESLIYAIMREESEFDPRAISPASAYGLMQLILPTARTAARRLGLVANARTLLQPSVNIALGTRVLSTLLDRFKGEPILVAAGYNAGPGRPARWLGTYPAVDTDLWVELIEYQETRSYVKRVVESYATYRWLYSDHPIDSRTIETLPERLGEAPPN
ncbi:MAG TPA: lytic transglycosylase domain-containing protein, partial [Polyangiaceae bacterium]|nr:lytic transglycosylase domain-containing protein [Polyangiaceae bacterium]